METVLLKSELEEVRRWAAENSIKLDDLFFIQAETPKRFLELNPEFVRLYIEALAEDGISYAEFCTPYKGVPEAEFSKHVTECAEKFGIRVLLDAALNPKFNSFTCVFIRQNSDGTFSAW